MTTTARRRRPLVVIIIIVVVVVVRAPLRPVDVLDELAAVRRAPERVGALREHELRDDRAGDDERDHARVAF